MRYIDHIRNMSDDQLAYFLNAIQPEITERIVALPYSLPDWLKARICWIVFLWQQL